MAELDKMSKSELRIKILELRERNRHLTLALGTAHTNFCELGEKFDVHMKTLEAMLHS